MSVENVHETVFVTSLTDGVLDPAKPMLGPVRPATDSQASNSKIFTNRI